MNDNKVFFIFITSFFIGVITSNVMIYYRGLGIWDITLACIILYSLYCVYLLLLLFLSLWKSSCKKKKELKNTIKYEHTKDNVLYLPNTR